jgi:hypothetical protein
MPPLLGNSGLYASAGLCGLQTAEREPLGVRRLSPTHVRGSSRVLVR